MRLKSFSLMIAIWLLPVTASCGKNPSSKSDVTEKPRSEEVAPDEKDDQGDESQPKGIDPTFTDGKLANATLSERVQASLAECRLSEGVKSGIAVLLDARDPTKPRALCGAVAYDDHRILTTNGCTLPEDLSHVVAAVARTDHWMVVPIDGIRKSPYELLTGWMTKPGSLDLVVLSTPNHLGERANILDHTKRGIQFGRYDFYYLSDLETSCFSIKKYSLPMGYSRGSNFGLPLQLNGIDHDPEIFVGGTRLTCAMTRPGTILTIFPPTEDRDTEYFAGIYSRTYLFYNDDCDARGDEIFLKLSTASAWLENQ